MLHVVLIMFMLMVGWGIIVLSIWQLSSYIGNNTIKHRYGYVVIACCVIISFVLCFCILAWPIVITHYIMPILLP